VLNDAAARALSSAGDVLGRRVWLGRADSDAPRKTVVGIVQDVRFQGLSQPVLPEMYLALEQMTTWTPGTVDLVVRTEQEPSSLVPSVRAVVQSIDPEQPIANIATMDELLSRSVSQPRFNALLIGLFALVATLVAAVGIYGVVAYWVGRRTREIGVRTALGAQPADIVRMVLIQGSQLTAAGVGLGLVLAFGLTRFLTSLLFEVSPRDGQTLATAAGAFALAGCIACLVPAHRASRVDPAKALRND
jgi:ABC-type antimicrobial peptide transport system permease subunit